MVDKADGIDARVTSLERQVRLLRLIVAGTLALAIALGLVPRPAAQQSNAVVRARQVVVEDGNGQARMILGYLDAPGNTRRFGIRINDPRGAERFGLSYIDNGSLVMGIDAPPGTGDDRNRERINLTADEKGGAHIRFLDRRTSVASRWYLDDQNRAWIQFSDFAPTPPQIRRYGLTGEEVVQP
jgi:hypothetical protein